MSVGLESVVPQAVGTLGSVPFASVLSYCWERRLNGCLVLAREAPGDGSDVVRFLDGLPAKIRLRERVEHLGRILVELGSIDDQTYNQSLLELSRGGSLHGQILLKSGKIDERTLARGLEVQLRRKLGSLFARTALTTFAYYDGIDLLEDYGGPELHPIAPAPVIWAGIRTYPPHSHIDATLAKIGPTQLAIGAQTDLTDLDLTRPELALVETVRAAPCTLDELVSARIVSEPSVRCFVYAMLLLRRFELRATSSVAPHSRERDVAPPSSAKGALAGTRTTPARPESPLTPALPPSRSQTMPAVTPPGRSQPMPAVTPPGPAVASAPAASAPPRRWAPRRPNEIDDILGNVEPPPSVGVPPIEELLAATRAATGGPVDAAPTMSSSELDARRAMIKAKLASLHEHTYFQVLDVEPESTLDELRDRYFVLARTWHPDKLPPELADARDDAAQVFDVLARAYKTLSDPITRTDYLARLGKGGSTVAALAQAPRQKDAKTLHEKASMFVKSGLFNEAAPLARRAHETEPEDPTYLALYCWVQANQRDRRAVGGYDDLLDKLTQAVKAHPENDVPRYYRGLLRKLAGRLAEATDDFRVAAKLNPRNVDAAREVRLAAMRR